MIHTDWTEVEVIELLVDSTAGLGFGMCGGKSTGIIVRHIHPGGAAETDGRLRLGDHIVCVQEFNVRGFGPDQVATVLRHTISANLLSASLNPDLQEEKAGQIQLTEGKSVEPELDWPRRSIHQANHSPPAVSTTQTSKSIHSPLANTSFHQSDDHEQSMAEVVVQAVPIRFIVARPVQGSPQELNKEYEMHQRLANENQVFGTVSLVPTDHLDDYLEGLVHSSLPIVNLQTLQRLSASNPEDNMRNATKIDSGAHHVAVPNISVDDSSEEPVSGVSSTCQPSSPRVTRAETNETNHESENSNHSNGVPSIGISRLSTTRFSDHGFRASGQDSTDQRDSHANAFGRPFSPLLADEDESQSGNGKWDGQTERECENSGEVETHTVTLHRPKYGGLGLTIVGYVYKLPDCSK
ncbi:InaD [Fasciola hepatica]|uniref:InaD n=1 Tax=Fasciola hepatica TaxID=6192 RepID=A0A4E0RXT8_FASHE|nr:InaD [Fasciola hepatica]